jgi:hypothetical protein
LADRLLPLRERVDVVVDARVAFVRGHSDRP